MTSTSVTPPPPPAFQDPPNPPAHHHGGAFIDPSRHTYSTGYLAEVGLMGRGADGECSTKSDPLPKMGKMEMEEEIEMETGDARGIAERGEEGTPKAQHQPQMPYLTARQRYRAATAATPIPSE